tara:strand:- start:1837 stop:2028 length:192 start_codon:yes stop_codon:yes gene_type:complete
MGRKKKKRNRKNDIQHIEVVSIKNRNIRTIELKKSHIFFDEETGTYQEVTLDLSGSTYSDKAT